MKKVALINMPFTSVGAPSIALTQLKYKLEDDLKNNVFAKIFYLNHDFVEYLGLDTYSVITESLNSLNIGLGDWFFRQSAFPDQIDNKNEYFQRFFYRKTDDLKDLEVVLETKRLKIDCFLKELIERYQLTRFDVVGFTSMFSQNVASFAMARHIKDLNPKITTVLGGANCEPPMGQEIAKHVKSIDYVFSGPSLITFPKFIFNIIKGETSKCKQIKGVYHKDSILPQQGNMIRGEELDINEFMELNYDSFVKLIEEKYQNDDVKITLPFETSRGCWWGERAHCTFCGSIGVTKRYRSMNPENAIKLISSLFKYSPRVTQLEGVDNIMPREFIKNVLPHLNTPDSMRIFYEIKADLSAEEMQILSDARVNIIQPGIESLATSTLKKMKKGTTSFRNIEFLKNCLLYDIYPLWNILIGFPGEEADIYKKYLTDIPKFTHLPPPNGIFPIRYDRYSPYFNKAIEYGLDLHPLPYYELIYPFPESSLNNLAYSFADYNYHSEHVEAMVKYLQPLQEAIDVWRKSWYSRDEHPTLYLSRHEDEYYVTDSRSNMQSIFQISELAANILKELSPRKRIEELCGKLKFANRDKVEQEVENLRERGLLFEEKGKILSLTLLRKTSGFTHLN